MSPNHPRFTQASIDRLKTFKANNLTIAHADFRQTLQLHPHHFLYLDPPYANGGALYGAKGDLHKKFPHALLAQMLYKRSKWIMSYNDCTLIRELYKSFKIIHLSWTYGMNKTKRSNEILIISHDLAS